MDWMKTMDTFSLDSHYVPHLDISDRKDLRQLSHGCNRICSGLTGSAPRRTSPEGAYKIVDNHSESTANVWTKEYSDSI
jgi:hypothetical protein